MFLAGQQADRSIRLAANARFFLNEVVYLVIGFKQGFFSLFSFS